MTEAADFLPPMSRSSLSIVMHYFALFPLVRRKASPQQHPTGPHPCRRPCCQTCELSLYGSSTYHQSCETAYMRFTLRKPSSSPPDTSTVRTARPNNHSLPGYRDRCPGISLDMVRFSLPPFSISQGCSRLQCFHPSKSFVRVDQSHAPIVVPSTSKS